MLMLINIFCIHADMHGIIMDKDQCCIHPDYLAKYSIICLLGLAK